MHSCAEDGMARREQMKNGDAPALDNRAAIGRDVSGGKEGAEAM
jgi:hypothetical protein